MKIQAHVFTYERPQMLDQVIRNLQHPSIGVNIYSDGVDFPRRGKEKFWQTWDEALGKALKSDAELFIFSPDDFLDLDLNRLLNLHKVHKGQPYVYNIINDGRVEQWVRFTKKAPINGTEQVGFTDCGFFCNREALEAIGFYMRPVNPRRFSANPNMSSGVGQQLTIRFTKAGIKMYKPVKSLATHGDHESKMNPLERKKNPLISR